MRLIDGDVLIEFIENRYSITWKDDYEGGIKDACTDILEKISRMPTIETERKKGKWTEAEPRSGKLGWVCSCCDHEAYWDSDYGQQLFGWCPWCGADMRGEADE